MSFVVGNQHVGEKRQGKVVPLFVDHQALTLRAASASTGAVDALERHLPLELLGVHERGLNLLCGEEVLSLTGTDAGNLPRGILVDLPEGTTWTGMSLPAGGRARVEGRYLWLSREVRIDLVGGPVWESRRFLRSVGTPSQAVRMAVHVAAASLAGATGLGAAAVEIEKLAGGDAPETSSELLFYPVAARRLAALMGALSRSDLAGLLEAGRGLVGLGIGLTPSGDDVLTGLLGSLVLISDYIPALGWARPVAAELTTWAWGRTHPVSLTYLRCAAAGEIGQMQERLLQALVDGDSAMSLSACDALRKFGHSSGGEIALGALLAVEASARHFWPR